MNRLKWLLLAFSALLMIAACDSASDDDNGDDGDGDTNVLTKQLKVLVISNNLNDLNNIKADWQPLMPNFEISTHVATSSDTISSTKMDSFDVVILHENGNHNMAETLGDTLYKHILAGGHAILGVFYAQGSRNSTGATSYGTNMKTIDPAKDHTSCYSNHVFTKRNHEFAKADDHPLFRGVDSMSYQYTGGDSTVANGATLISRWDNSRDILAAYTEPGGRLLYLSLFPAEENHSTVTGNDTIIFRRMWANAIRYVYAMGTTDADFTGSDVTKKPSKASPMRKRTPVKPPAGHTGSLK